MDGDYTDLKILLANCGGICLFLGILGLVIRAAVGSAKPPTQPPPRPSPPQYPPPRAFEVIRENSEPVDVLVTEADESGQFQVDGVDRESRMDTRWYCYAASEGNAKAKAELEGIIVTRVTKLS